MQNRSSTPDILGSIMTGSLSKPSPKPPVEESKEKATFNLPKSVLIELEDICHEIRKHCKSKQISKTLIVEEALKMAFQEFRSVDKKSILFEKLRKYALEHG